MLGFRIVFAAGNVHDGEDIGDTEAHEDCEDGSAKDDKDGPADSPGTLAAQSYVSYGSYALRCTGGRRTNVRTDGRTHRIIKMDMRPMSSVLTARISLALPTHAARPLIIVIAGSADPPPLPDPPPPPDHPIQRRVPKVKDADFQKSIEAKQLSEPQMHKAGVAILRRNGVDVCHAVLSRVLQHTQRLHLRILRLGGDTNLT